MQSDRLTLRGIHPKLKHALYLRSQAEKTSIEKTVVKILEKELESELKTLEVIDELASQLPVG